MSKTFELAQKVKFVRMTPEQEAVYGEGIIVSKLIGVSKRINYSVRDAEAVNERGTPKAWNLEPEALDGTDEENAAYIAHHARITGHIKLFEAAQNTLVKNTNDEIEAMHVEFFGAPLEI
jgi:hypothetical protein